MDSTRRPISIWIIAFLYVAVGVAGFIGHFHSLLAREPDSIMIELTELAAIIAGIFLFLGHNWARWLALAWIAFHVILSIFHPVRELVIHAVLCALIAWGLFHPGANRYFGRARSSSPPDAL
ncbi:MAG TPA: hypothetical protein VF126_16745 [Acidobacteriaceae bacterium]